VSAKNPRTLAELRADPRVLSVHQEIDGYGDTEQEQEAPSWWVGLREGLITSRGTNSIHTKTIAEACAEMRDVEVVS